MVSSSLIIWVNVSLIEDCLLLAIMEECRLFATSANSGYKSSFLFFWKSCFKKLMISTGTCQCNDWNLVRYVNTKRINLPFFACNKLLLNSLIIIVESKSGNRKNVDLDVTSIVRKWMEKSWWHLFARRLGLASYLHTWPNRCYDQKIW